MKKVAANESKDMPVLDRKIRSSIRGILGRDDAQYSPNIQQMVPAHQYRKVLDSYGVLCAHMQAKSLQWSKKLMLQSRGVDNESNFLAAYSMEHAPEAVRGMADLRMFFLSQLYDRLPTSEKRTYGELLSPSYFSSGSMPDIRAASVLYKLQDLHLIQLRRLYDVHASSQRITDLGDRSSLLVPMLATLAMERFMDEAWVQAPQAMDSLFARLLLNTAVNRFCCELTELERLNSKAAEHLSGLVKHLMRIFGSSLPRVRDEADIQEVVLTAMSLPGATSWRAFKDKDSALKHVLERAKATADTDNLMRQYPLNAPYLMQYLLLASLAVAWSYCTADIHDTRIIGAGHRKHQVINGRGPKSETSCSPALLVYHRRQYSLLWTSGQAFELCPERLDIEHIESMSTRRLLRRLAQKLKPASLAQWGMLDHALTDYLEGTPWDAEQPLVESGNLKAAAESTRA